MNSLLKFILVINAIILVNCAGGKASYKFDQLKYPASMSGYLYNEENQPVAIGKELKRITTFSHEQKYWGIFYSLVNLTDSKKAIDAMNTAVRNNNGKGIVNISFMSENCGINTAPVLNFLPFWPGCTVSRISGDVVTLK